MGDAFKSAQIIRLLGGVSIIIQLLIAFGGSPTFGNHKWSFMGNSWTMIINGNMVINGSINLLVLTGKKLENDHKQCQNVLFNGKKLKTVGLFRGLCGFLERKQGHVIHVFVDKMVRIKTSTSIIVTDVPRQMRRLWFGIWADHHNHPNSPPILKSHIIVLPHIAKRFWGRLMRKFFRSSCQIA